MKKQIISMLALLIGLGGSFSSCSDDDEVLAELKVIPETLTFTALGGTENVSISTNMETWELKEDTANPWCKAEKTKTPNQLTVTVEEFNEKTDRTAKIKIISGNEEKIINVIQKGVQAQLEVDKNKITINGFGSETRIKVTASKENWEIATTENPEWIITKKDGEYLVIGATLSEVERNGKILLTLDDAKLELNVTQTAAAVQVGDIFMGEDGETAVGIVLGKDSEKEYIYVLSLKEKNIAFSSMDIYTKMTIETQNVADDGFAAQEIIKKANDWKTNYPAAAYCDELENTTGVKGWYIPGVQENFVWNAIKNNEAKLNESLKALGDNANTIISTMPSYTKIWTSTVHKEANDTYPSGVCQKSYPDFNTSYSLAAYTAVTRPILRIKYIK